VSGTSKHEVGEAVAVALGKLIGKEYRIDGWLGRLVEELDRELSKINCKVKLYSMNYTVNRGRVDRINYAEILVYCNEQYIFVRIYVDLVEYVRVTDARIEFRAE
jgi:hypothetical protein